MISPKPNTPAWSVLALVVAHPGELDAESIGQRLWLALPATPPPPVSRGFADPMSHPGRRAWFDALASTVLRRIEVETDPPTPNRNASAPPRVRVSRVEAEVAVMRMLPCVEVTLESST